MDQPRPVARQGGDALHLHVETTWSQRDVEPAIAARGPAVFARPKPIDRAPKNINFAPESALRNNPQIAEERDGHSTLSIINALSCDLWGLLSESWKPAPELGVTVFLQALEKRGPD